MNNTIPVQRVTRRPTGIPSWPILLIAGIGKSGKSWSCAEASASAHVGQTLWIGIGEDEPDELGALPGADFELVPHDGTYVDILAAIEWASAQPDVAGLPTLLVIDSMTRLWDLLCSMAQDTANARGKRKRGGRDSDVEEPVTMDLWNQAKDRWGHIMDALRAHRGPVLVTARLEEVVVVVGGKPTHDKVLKIKAEKSLPYDVGGIVEMPERGKAYLTGVRTTRMSVPEKLILPGFTVEKLWTALGLADSVSRDRPHSSVNRSLTDPVATQRQLLLGEIKTLVNENGAELRRIATDWADTHDGQDIRQATDIGALALLRDDTRTYVERSARQLESVA
jgi:hypothetical protein